MKAAAVLRGADAKRAQEHPAHGLRGAEAAASCDRPDRLVAVLQPAPRGLKAHALDVAGGGHAGLGAERTGEVTPAHVGARCHRLDTVIAGDVLEHGALDLAQRRTLGLLRREGRAELRLVAGAAQEQHEVARDRERCVAAEVLLDERQREVHAGGHARGGPQRTVAHEDRLWIDEHVGMLALQLGRGRPVRRRAAAVEQPGAGEHERARAHRRRASGPAGCAGYPVEQGPILARLRMTGSTGDDQRVDWRRPARELVVRDQAEAAGGLQRLAAAAEHAHVVAALAAGGRLDQLLGAGEDLERPGHIEALHARIDDDHDQTAVGDTSHTTIIPHRRAVRKDGFPTVSAIAAADAGGRRPTPWSGAKLVRTRAGAALYDGPMEGSQTPASEHHELEFFEDEGPDTLSAAPGRVASIVAAAESASRELRDQAEVRARERIEEADRAAEIRVQAAEEEAEELVSSAREHATSTKDEAESTAAELKAEAESTREEAARGLEQAREEATRTLEQAREQSERLLADTRRESEQVWATAHQESERVRASAREESEQLRTSTQQESERLLAAARQDAERIEREAREQSDGLLASGREELARMLQVAEEQTKGIKAKAREEARDITSDAHVVARDILSEGTEISRNLRELSTSLRNNAERLISDVRLTHGGMTARLDQLTNGAEPEAGDATQTRTRRRVSGAGGSSGGSGANDDLDVPEFIPRG